MQVLIDLFQLREGRHGLAQLTNQKRTLLPYMRRQTTNNMVETATTTPSCILKLANMQAKRTVMTTRINIALGITHKKKVTHKPDSIKGRRTIQWMMNNTVASTVRTLFQGETTLLQEATLISRVITHTQWEGIPVGIQICTILPHILNSQTSKFNS